MHRAPHLWVSRALVAENALFALAIYGLLVAACLLDVDDHGLRLLAIYGFGSVLLKALLGRHLQIATFTVPGFFYLSYLLLFVVPSLLVYQNMTHPIRSAYLHGSLGVLVLFPGGVLAAELLGGTLLRRRRVDTYSRSPCQVTRADIRMKPIVMGGYWASVLIGALYCSYLEVIPILKIFRPLADTYGNRELRFMFEQVPPIVAFAFSFCRIVVVPTCLMYLYILRKRNLVAPMRFYLYTAGAAVLASLSLDRGPVLIVFLMLAISDCLASAGGLLNRRTWVRATSLLGAGILVVSVVSAAQQGEVDQESYAENVEHMIAKRIFLSPATVASQAFEATPGPEFLGGRYIRVFTFLTSGEYIKGSEAPPLVILPCGFMADLWRNWGATGIVTGALFFGAYTQFFQLISFVRKTVSCVLAQAFFLLGVLWLVPGNAIGALTTTVLLLGGFGSFAARQLTSRSPIAMNVSRSRASIRT